MKGAWLGVVGLMALAIGCGGDDDDGSSSGAGSGGSGGSGALGGSAGASGSGGSAGEAGSAGQSGSGGAAGSGGTGGQPHCGQVPLTFADGLSPSGSLHIDATASPGGDGSAADPYQSLHAAAANASPGTELVIHGELVSTSSITLAGTPSAPFWIRGEPGAVLRGSQGVPALRFTNTSYVIVQDLELAESPNHVLHFDFSDHLLFRNLHVHRATTACLKGSQSTRIYVEDCDFHGAGELPGGNPQSTQVFDYVGVNDGHIVRSRFHDGPQVMVMLKGGTSNLFFAYNEIYDQTGGGNAALHIGQSTGPQFFQPLDADYEARQIVAYANVIHDVAGPPFAFQGAYDCAAVHNTFFETDGAQLVRYLPGNVGEDSSAGTSLSRGSRFTGNIVVGGQASGASLNADASSIGDGNQLDHNVWLKPGSLNWWSPLEQETAHSTYDQDPQLSPEGVPENVALVDGKGPTDLDAIPFNAYFLADFSGACVTEPRDLGAIEVP